MTINNDDMHRLYNTGAPYNNFAYEEAVRNISKAANEMYQDKYVPPQNDMMGSGCPYMDYYNNYAMQPSMYQPWDNGCVRDIEDAQNLYYFVPQEPTAEPASSMSGELDVQQIREDFPILKRKVHNKPLVWMDNAATTQKPMCVMDSLNRYYTEYNSNVHRGASELSKEATAAYEEAREKAARFIGAASKDEVVFVRGTTEGINLVADTWGMQNLGEGDEIIISIMEHHSNLVPWQEVAQKKGAVIKVVPVDERGVLDMDAYQKMCSPRTKLVAITHVSNVLGTVNPVAKIAQIAHMHGAKVLVDGAQSTPHMPIDVKALDADFYAMSGHKVYGPTGIGVLYGKKDLLESMPVYQVGGGMVNKVTLDNTTFHGPPGKYEAGTVNIADAIAFGAAIDYLQRVGMNRIHQYETELTQYLMNQMKMIPGVWIFGTAPDKTSVVSFVMNSATPKEIADRLNLQGIAIRAGYHCAQPLHRSFGLTGTARASLGFYNTYDEVDFFVRNIRDLAMR